VILPRGACSEKTDGTGHRLATKRQAESNFVLT
jgi:hypothetical protein